MSLCPVEQICNSVGAATAARIATAGVLLLDTRAQPTVPHRRARGCSPVFVSYGHYPLGVIQYPDTRPFYAPDPVGPPPQQRGSVGGPAALRPVTLRSVLEKRRVQVRS